MKNYIIAILLILVLIYLIFLFIGSSIVNQKMLNLYDNKKYDEYLKYLDSTACKLFIKEAEREEYKYKIYLKNNDRVHIEEYFNKLLSKKVDRNTMLAYQIKAFYYYMEHNGVSKCEKLYQDIKEYGDEEVTKQVNYLYEIVVLKKGSYIKEIEDYLKEHPNNSFYQYILSESYENIGDKANAKKYKKLYKENMKK